MMNSNTNRKLRFLGIDKRNSNGKLRIQYSKVVSHEAREINLIRLVDAPKDTIRQVKHEFG